MVGMKKERCDPSEYGLAIGDILWGCPRYDPVIKNLRWFKVIDIHGEHVVIKELDVTYLDETINGILTDDIFYLTLVSPEPPSFEDYLSKLMYKSVDSSCWDHFRLGDGLILRDKEPERIHNAFVERCTDSYIDINNNESMFNCFYIITIPEDEDFIIRKLDKIKGTVIVE